jgi:hypothetical protein
MSLATRHIAEVNHAAPYLTFVSLERETRAAVDTATAAYHLSRQPQTLRAWACLENGPLRPVRVHGRLAWPVSELRRVLGVAA